MSSIGSGPGGIPPIVSSAAGTQAQQKSADTNRTQQDGNVQRFQMDRADQYEKAVGDIGESDSTDDRDADGRMPWVIKRTQNSSSDDATATPPANHAPDPLLERGQQLDLDA